MRKNYFSWAIPILLTLLTGFLLFESLRLYLFLPYTDNEGAFVLFGREMGRGARLYTDLWDHKPPLLFAQSWILQALIPLTETRLHLYALLTHALNAFLIFHVARRLSFSTEGAWASTLAYVFFLFPPLFQPWAVEADLLIQPFLLLSFWAAFFQNKRVLFLSGAFWAAAFFTKQSALFVIPVYLMAGAFSDIPKILRWLAGAGLVAGVVVLPFLLNRSWTDFYAALIGFNQHYIEKGWDFFFATPAFRDFLVSWTKMAGWTYGLAFLIMVLGSAGTFSKPPHSRTLFFLWVWLFGVLAACGVSGYFFTYYFIALLPPLALGVGLAWMKLRQGHREDLYICFILLAAEVAVLGTDAGGIRDKVSTYAQYSAPRYLADKAMGLLIAAEAKPADRLLSWSDDPQIYVYLEGRAEDALKTMENFSRHPPRYCVVSRMDQVITPPGWFLAQLQEHYLRVKSMGDLDLYRLR
jgi:hypothetical protein